MRLKYDFLDTEHDVELLQRSPSLKLKVGEQSLSVRSLHTNKNPQKFVIGDREHDIFVARDGDKIFIHAYGESWEVRAINAIDAATLGRGSTNAVLAPMPGTVVQVHVKAGEDVTEGQILIVIESMKLQTSIVAERDGAIAEVLFATDESFNKGAELMRFAEADTSAEPGKD